MKRALAVMTTALVAATFGFAGMGLAQEMAQPQVEISSAGAPSTDLPMAQYRAFDQFRADHPEIVAELSRNPRLLRSESFQAKNPALRDFFSSHPQMKADMEENPGDFLPLEAPHYSRNRPFDHITKHTENTLKGTARGEAAKGEGSEGSASSSEPSKPAGVSTVPSSGSDAPAASGSDAPSESSSGGGSSEGN